MKLLRLRKNQHAIVFELLIASAMAIVIFFALMNIGTFINGTVSKSLTDSLPAVASRKGASGALANMSENSLNNVSGGFDKTVNIMIIAAIITMITVPLAAVIAIKQLM